jgi:hypothetical protein
VSKITRTDTFIEIGSQHKICEDYIVSGNNYIILADGCSSSENSEIGARLLCYMAKQFIKSHTLEPDELSFSEKMGSWIIYNADVLARHLGLKVTCLDATLIISYIQNGHINIHMFGDGFLVLTRKNIEQYEVYSIEYKSGTKSMPYYLRYLLDQEGAKLYHDQKVIKTLRRMAVYENRQKGYAIPEEIAYDHPEYYRFSLDDFESISICSDGLGSFLKATPDSDGNKIMKAEELVPDIFNFESTAGVFLQRRMNLLERRLRKTDSPLNHFDDLSIGTYLMEEVPNAQNSEVK